ncbi:geranylgeranylglyceryl/heptaprenylglyceryl phosphate synthase [candidate division WOR-3 bacterium]|nr:geranylgeranylglyceryl/heptaprenylglyceryl phosphate synthase [candidate division WOR-3 bacterium]
MKRESIYNSLNKSKPGVLALFDPDRIQIDNIKKLTEFVCEQGIAGILAGSSLLVSPHFDKFVATVKKSTDKPVILFPGGSHQVSAHADAIFFLSLLSGRNSEFLIGEQVKAVFLIKEYDLEVISVGYILVESGNYTAVEYMSNTKPIPRSKPEIAVAHALAGEYFGMKYIYLEAGSGADKPVPENMIKKIKKAISIPLIVGGGIRTEKHAQRIIEAGADFIVLGSIIEKSKEQFKKIMRSIGGPG